MANFKIDTQFLAQEGAQALYEKLLTLLTEVTHDAIDKQSHVPLQDCARYLVEVVDQSMVIAAEQVLNEVNAHNLTLANRAVDKKDIN